MSSLKIGMNAMNRIADSLLWYLVGTLTLVFVLIIMLLAGMNLAASAFEKKIAFEHLLTDQVELQLFVANADTIFADCKEAGSAFASWKMVKRKDRLKDEALQDAQCRLGALSLLGAKCFGAAAKAAKEKGRTHDFENALSAFGKCLYIAGRETDFEFEEEDWDLIRTTMNLKHRHHRTGEDLHNGQEILVILEHVQEGLEKHLLLRRNIAFN